MIAYSEVGVGEQLGDLGEIIMAAPLYFNRVFEDFNGVVMRAARVLGPKQFDALAFCGNSGAMIGPAVATAISRQMILVRKPVDDHYYERVETTLRKDATFTYAIIDDFVASGATVKYIKEQIAALYPKARWVGVYEYERDADRLTRALYRNKENVIS
jgi:adenine/guanine phosphoribosyltransferase-like PRPP-binding protein